MSEGVYVSEQHRARHRRKVAGAVAGAVVVLGAVAYGTTSWMSGRDATVTEEPGAFAPLVSAPPMEPSALPSPSASVSPATPAPGLGPATKAGVRQSSRPSPTPSPPAMTDEDLASAQVARLLEPGPARSGINAAGIQNDRVTVRHEVTPDGANVRVVSAKHDLTQSWQKLWVADMGKPVGTVRCTQNFRTEGQSTGQIRPGLLLCWRTAPGRSVVAIATGRPQEVFVAAVVEREWSILR